LREGTAIAKPQRENFWIPSILGILGVRLRLTGPPLAATLEGNWSQRLRVSTSIASKTAAGVKAIAKIPASLKAARPLRGRRRWLK